MHRISKHLRSVHGPDGAILLDLERGRVLHLNSTGSYIFERLNRGESGIRIAEEMSRSLHVSRDVAISDIGEFLQLLEREGLIETTAQVVT